MNKMIELQGTKEQIIHKLKKYGFDEENSREFVEQIDDLKKHLYDEETILVYEMQKVQKNDFKVSVDIPQGCEFVSNSTKLNSKKRFGRAYHLNDPLYKQVVAKGNPYQDNTLTAGILIKNYYIKVFPSFLILASILLGCSNCIDLPVIISMIDIFKPACKLNDEEKCIVDRLISKMKLPESASPCIYYDSNCRYCTDGICSTDEKDIKEILGELRIRKIIR